MTYAIFKAAGFQYRAELGDVLRLPSLDAESGDTVTFDEVLLGSADGEMLIGKPTVEGAAVRAEILRHGRADKITVFKFKRRKNYRRKQGHRQNFTEIRVSEIDLGDDRRVSLEDEKEKAKKRKTTAKKKGTRKATKKKTEAKAAAPEEAPPAEEKEKAKKKTSGKKTTGKKTKKPAAKAGGKSGAKGAGKTETSKSKPKGESKSKGSSPSKSKSKSSSKSKKKS